MTFDDYIKLGNKLIKTINFILNTWSSARSFLISSNYSQQNLIINYYSSTIHIPGKLLKFAYSCNRILIIYYMYYEFFHISLRKHANNPIPISYVIDTDFTIHKEQLCTRKLDKACEVECHVIFKCNGYVIMNIHNSINSCIKKKLSACKII